MIALLLATVLAVAAPSVGAGPAAPAPAAPAAPAPGGFATATPRHFTASATPSTVRLGEPFVLEVAITDAADVRYELPRPLRLGDLAVRRVELQRAPAGDETVTTARIELAIYDVIGSTQLPDLVFTALRDGGVARLTVPGPALEVQGDAQGEELDDIRPQQELRVFSPLPLYAAGGFLLACAAIVFAVRALRRRKKPAPPAPVRTPEERALDALEALEIPAAGDGRPYYFALSEIVRGFLEEVSSLRAREMTTSELVEALVVREVPGLSLTELGAWLERGDLHRFARAPLDPAQARADREKAAAIVRGVAGALRPAPAPAAEEAA